MLALGCAPRRFRGSFAGRCAVVLALVGSSLTLGCRERTQTDPHVEEGYRLLPTDPKAALAELKQAKDPSDPRVLVGRGMALERLRQFAEADTVLTSACSAKSDATCWVTLTRVRIALGKLDEARQAIDQLVLRDQTEFFGVLLEAFLAHDQARARTSLAHLEKWDEHARDPEHPLEIPAEFYLAQLTLYRQLEMRREFESTREQAKLAKLAQLRGTFGLVEIAMQAGRSGLAVELLRKMDDEHPSVELRLQIAQLAHRLGAHRLVGDILDTLPGKDVATVTLRGEHDFATGQSRAVATLKDAVDVTEDAAQKARLRLMLAEAYLRNQQFNEARVEAEAVQQGRPSDEGVLLLARLDLTQKAPEAALQRLAPQLARAPASLQVRELAAHAHLVLGHQGEAKTLLDAILAEQPAQAHAARLRVALEAENRKPKEAVRIAQDLVRRAPADAGLRLLLADAVRKAEGPAASAQSLRDSSQALPSSAAIWIALVRVLDETNADALAVLEEAHQKVPDEAVITAALAARLAKTGASARAAALYQALIQRAERDPVALNNLAVIYSDELNDPAQAVALAERAYTLSTEPPIVDTLGWALYRRKGPGDLERALVLLQSVSGSLGSPSARYHLGAVLIASGKAAEGKALLTQALAQGEDFPGAAEARTLLNGK